MSIGFFEFFNLHSAISRFLAFSRVFGAKAHLRFTKKYFKSSVVFLKLTILTKNKDEIYKKFSNKFNLSC